MYIYKEAKAWLDKINANPHWNRVDIEEPALSQLNELFEKATPKKIVKREEDIGEELADAFDCERYITVEYCPICGEKLRGIEKYCLKCGQALDWSEDDEKD